MNVVILNEKLGVTPENLFPIVRNYLGFYSRQDEDGKTISSYYKAEKSPNINASIVSTHQQYSRRVEGDITMIPLNPIRSRVFIMFDDWENHTESHGWAAFSELEPDPKKRQMFLDLGKYILGTVTSIERANAWLATAITNLEAMPDAASQSKTMPWEHIPSALDQLIARLLYEKCGNEEIAKRLKIDLGMKWAPKTVANHLAKMRKRYPHIPLLRVEI
jgi:hypothetical protein